ncbi:hypothetical protein [Streptomyces parvus]|uniref:hypothetical protein n=1 Tax=Streptomyces parvus TaxID=66428 RepID=UPI002101B2AC|nr:hypothetical protein [Streptomyces parvus]MCQ1579337.1 hypothetical protein [Streptomyces parvus]
MAEEIYGSAVPPKTWTEQVWRSPSWVAEGRNAIMRAAGVSTTLVAVALRGGRGSQPDLPGRHLRGKAVVVAFRGS